VTRTAGGWCRRSPKIGEVLPLFYLYGLSSGDFAAAACRSDNPAAWVVR